ncbi:hypothetical protein R1T15_13245 [Mucilaginibacter sp. L3T2-6]|uniref:NHL domain-containing protein n=1 Tax=Mucilaginibacter sp. L3T2-6 TaxID=3062491 RepID=UPI002949FEC2|nr:hypothetical protein [Mucilaginibacter sp. L3T2-6]MDV6215472.1 hypothetical protein [Mucilaginibacter sp. L3T2-6]
MKKPHFILALALTMSATACLKTHNEPSSVLVSTLAGSETYGSADGTGSSASFHRPRGIAVDRWGYVYVADSGNGLIRKISPGGVVKTFAGSSDGFADGTGTSAKFSLPLDVATDAAGNVYVADNYNKRIRKISPEGVVTTLAGSGALGSANGPALSASFAWPHGVATDKSGNVYVADTNNSLIRKIGQDGTVTTFASTGTNGDTDGPAATASFYYPTHLVVDAANNIYISDDGNNRIRKISAEGIVSTFAGSGARGSIRR